MKSFSRTVVVVPWHDGVLDRSNYLPSLPRRSSRPGRGGDRGRRCGGTRHRDLRRARLAALFRESALASAARRRQDPWAPRSWSRAGPDATSPTSRSRRRISGAPGSPFVKQVLRAFPVPETMAFFEEIGVTLKEEPLGKLFPTTNKARTVLDALLCEARRLNVDIRTSCRVRGLRRRERALDARNLRGPDSARVASSWRPGGLSLPKTGSDGFGLRPGPGPGPRHRAHRARPGAVDSRRRLSRAACPESPTKERSESRGPGTKTDRAARIFALDSLRDQRAAGSRCVPVHAPRQGRGLEGGDDPELHARSSPKKASIGG